MSGFLSQMGGGLLLLARILASSAIMACFAAPAWDVNLAGALSAPAALAPWWDLLPRPAAENRNVVVMPLRKAA